MSSNKYKKESRESSDSSTNESSDSEQVNHIKPILKKTKKEIYQKERLDVLNKINKVFNLNDDNNKLKLAQITEEQINKIMKLKDAIYTYFYGKQSSVFLTSRSSTTKRPYLSLMKIVYREFNYNLERVDKKRKTKDGKWINDSYYILEKLK